MTMHDEICLVHKGMACNCPLAALGPAYVVERRSFLRVEERRFTHRVIQVDGNATVCLVPHYEAGLLVADALNMATRSPRVGAEGAQR